MAAKNQVGMAVNKQGVASILVDELRSFYGSSSRKYRKHKKCGRKKEGKSGKPLRRSNLHVKSPRMESSCVSQIVEASWFFLF